jgi:hypothetical protein
MSTIRLPSAGQPFGAQSPVDRSLQGGPVAVHTFGRRVQVEWDRQAAVTPLGQLAFCIEFLKLGGLFDGFVADCPLAYGSPNAPGKGDVLGTTLLSLLAGHRRYAHITSRRGDGVNPQLLGMGRMANREAVRRALQKIDAAAEIATPARLYRDRGDSENPFDEPNNHWGWGRFARHDLKRCRRLARFVALADNGWSLFVRPADPAPHREAISSRPPLPHALAEQTRQAGRTTITAGSMQAKADQARRALQAIAALFAGRRQTAEPLSDLERWTRILGRALIKYRNGRELKPPGRPIPAPA